MNYELVMLRGLAYCRKEAKRLEEMALKMALGTCEGESHSGITLMQATKIAQIALEKEKYQSCITMVLQALKKVPRGYRSLLVEVYLKNTPKEYFVEKYSVSLSTVYRKLTKARALFKDQLELLGCDAEWFARNFGGNDWLSAMLGRRTNGARAEHWQA